MGFSVSDIFGSFCESKRYPVLNPKYRDEDRIMENEGALCNRPGSGCPFLAVPC